MPLLVQLLRNPLAFASSSPGEVGDAAARDGLSRQLYVQRRGLPTMTASQDAVYRHVVEQRGTVTWGPPGERALLLVGWPVRYRMYPAHARHRRCA